MKIRKGDQVKIILGKDKGRTGTVERVLTKSSTLVVKDVNLYKKHVKPAQGRPGAIVTKERPLAFSKVQLICPNCKKPTRVGYKVTGTTKERLCRKCKAVILSPVL
ncbi:MAG: 50S ribosomal protein L24 [Candidatus Shapirobacteria bacterium]|jgi:large subunit ribosomal protein L24